MKLRPRRASRIRTKTAALVAFAFASVSCPSAHAGWYASPSLAWASLASRPLASEATPNYYGYKVATSFGYSLSQVLDLGAFYSYLPAQLNAAKLGGRDILLTSYGGEMALRLGESVYIGLRGGLASYELRTRKHLDEVGGQWTGPAGGIALGAVKKLTKQSFIQTSLELMHTITQRRKNDDQDEALTGEEPRRRRFDSLAISVAYVFNQHDSNRPDFAIIRDFIDTLSFF